MSETIVTRGEARVVIGPTKPTVIIGERINPTGKEWLKEAIRAGDWTRVGVLAQEQVAAGALIIDVNVAVSEAKETENLPRAVEAVQKAVSVPLCLDSGDPAALAAALRVCDGKVIINSVDGNRDKLEAILPLAKQYGSALIGLAMDKESGIPKTVGKRVEIARRILEAVLAAGIPKEDLIIDCLTLAVSADQGMGPVALETMRIISRELDLNVNMGVSNISFGLPERPLLNATFIAMACSMGLTCAIINPHMEPVVQALQAADVLLARDRRALGFLKAYRARLKAQEAARGAAAG